MYVDIIKRAQEARIAISDYCIHECNAFCCSKGILVLTEDELLAVFHDDKKQMSENKQYITKQPDGRFALDLSRDGKGCPSLNKKTKMCTIHSSSRRSKTCSDFPIFVHDSDKKIFISPRCFAHIDRKFYAFRFEAEHNGYRIVSENPF